MPPSSNDLTTARIMDHMNADHQRELSLYLQAFCNVSAAESIRNPHLTSFSLESITIATSPSLPPGSLQSSSTTPSAIQSEHSYTIPLSPPLASLSEARTYLVDLASHARMSLGLGDVDVNFFAGPRGLDLLPFFGVGIYYVCAAFLPWIISPGSASKNLLDFYFPGGAGTADGDGFSFAWLVRVIFWPVITIHLAEAWYFDRTRCKKYGPERGTGTWMLWIGAVLIEGFTAFRRFDKVVLWLREEKAEKKGKARAK